MACSPALQKVAPAHFLIIGSGNELRGDEAAGPQIADTVANWQLPSVKAISTPRLTTELVNEIAMAHYVIFVDAFSDHSRSRTVQLCPIMLGAASDQKLLPETSREISRETPQNTHRNHPLALLSLTKALYGRSPQAWWLRVPTERFGENGEKKVLSTTAERGCDRALTTIAQFLKTYRQPAEIGRSISVQNRQQKDCQQKDCQQKDYQQKDYQRKEARRKALALVP